VTGDEHILCFFCFTSRPNSLLASNRACVFLYDIYERSLGRYKRRWEDSIKANLREEGSESEEWIRMPQDWVLGWALVNTSMKIQLLKKEGNFSTSRGATAFSRRKVSH
jgi:hypothetical protein